MTVYDAIHKRVSSRYFRKGEKLEGEDVLKILEAGRLAPNGFGVEAWKFYFTQENQELFVEAAYGQESVKNASLLIFMTSPTSEYVKEHRAYLYDKILKNGMTGDKADNYYNTIISRDATKYFAEQVHIAAAQMVLQATELGIDSLMIGGFDHDELLKVLGLKPGEHTVSLILAFGHSDAPTKRREKKALDEIAVSLDGK